MYEVDFWKVSVTSKSADAISMRIGDPTTLQQAVVVIDAGFAEFGDELAEMIQTHYGTDVVDLAISTHPDADHINGFTSLLETLKVKELLIHRPSSRGHTGEVVASHVVEELIAVATHQGTLVTEPSQGLQRFGGAITIVGPSEELYQAMLDAQEAGTSGSSAMTGVLDALARQMVLAEKAVVSKIRKVLTGDPGETLTNAEGDTSPRNNTSVVTLLNSDGKSILLVGDAGVPALHEAAAFMKTYGLPGFRPSYIQVPHHGSRHNVSIEVLDRLLGPPDPSYVDGRWAIVSASEGDEKHPHPKVLNAFKRRGYSVVSNETTYVNLVDGFPMRAGIQSASPLPWYEEGDD